MKWLIRTFFKTIRAIVGPIILFLDWITTPRGVKRPANEQQKLDHVTANMALYQFKTCPFCIKVRRHIKRLSLNIDVHDAQNDATNRSELLNGGGQIKVPCLRIVDEKGHVSWMYESSEIVKYLDRHVAA